MSETEGDYGWAESTDFHRERKRRAGERVLLVGESNPYGSDHRFALYPLPENATGGRLCRILGLSAREYLRTFDRINLLPISINWPSERARRAAERLVHRRRILLGKRVCTAHGVPFVPFDHFSIGVDVWVLVLPHPSGRNLIWNDPANTVRARRAVAKFLEKQS